MTMLALGKAGQAYIAVSAAAIGVALSDLLSIFLYSICLGAERPKLALEPGTLILAFFIVFSPSGWSRLIIGS